MRSISFYDYGLEDIISGRKNSTVRQAEDEYEVDETLLLTLRSGEPVGYLTITNKAQILFKDIDESFSQCENWVNANELKSRLQYTYSKLSETSRLTKYEFVYAPALKSRLLRGKNTDLSGYLTRPLTILSSNPSKFKKYAAILNKMDIEFEFQVIDQYEEPLHLSSPEERAIVKSKAQGIYRNKMTMATDDMFLLEREGAVFQISDYRNLPLPTPEPGRITIRTGIALAYDTHINHCVVYRSFWYKAKGEPIDGENLQTMPLNSSLFLSKDARSPLAELNLEESKIYDPLRLAISNCIRGGCG